MRKNRLIRTSSSARVINPLFMISVLMGFSNTYAADVSTRLELQHRLDYQVPLTYVTFIGTHNDEAAAAPGAAAVRN